MVADRSRRAFRHGSTVRSFHRDEQPRVTVVVPAINEADNLRHVLPRIPGWVDEVVLVDGGSTDGTVDVARELLPDVVVVEQEGSGKGSALRQGFAAAAGEIIVMIDADGSTRPEEIGLFVRALRDGADFVKGSRFLQGAGSADMSTVRRVGNATFTRLVRVMFGSRYSDLCYGYNAFWAKYLPLLALDGDGFEIETMMNVRALRAGLRVVEVQSFEDERIHGTTNLNAITDGWRVLNTIVRERLVADRQYVRRATDLVRATPHLPRVVARPQGERVDETAEHMPRSVG